jgi:hypothetical protein
MKTYLDTVCERLVSSGKMSPIAASSGSATSRRPGLRVTGADPTDMGAPLRESEIRTCLERAMPHALVFAVRVY